MPWSSIWASFPWHGIMRYPCDIHETTYNSIMKCDVDIRKDLHTNTVLSGYGILVKINLSLSTFSYLLNLIKESLTIYWQKSQLWPQTQERSKLSHHQNEHIPIGGSILAAPSISQQMWISKQGSDESGPSIVYRECF